MYLFYVLIVLILVDCLFFFKQKPAYEMRIGDWSSDVCSSDLINEPLIERNWPDILRIMATIAAGIVAPSQILRKLASYPRQNELALALREVGRIERTLFMIDWILDAGLQRQAQIGLNKGEAHH